MESSEFPANSQKANEPEDPKKIEKIITGEVVRRKKPLGKRFLSTFVAGEDPKLVWGYVLFNVIIPDARDMVFNAGKEAMERALFPESRRRDGRRANRPGYSEPYINYSGYSRSDRDRKSSNRRDEPYRPAMSRRARATHDFKEIILKTRVEAEEVIDRMYELLDKYEQVTVRDLYSLVGEPTEYTDEKWGWRDLRGSEVSRLRHDQYLLDLPRTEPLD